MVRTIGLVCILISLTSCSTIELTTIQFGDREYRPVNIQYQGEGDGER